MKDYAELYRTIQKSTEMLKGWECVGQLIRENGAEASDCIFQIEKRITTGGGNLENQRALLKLRELESGNTDIAKRTVQLGHFLENRQHFARVDDCSISACSIDDERKTLLIQRLEPLNMLPNDGMSEDEVLRMAVEMCVLLRMCHSGRHAFYHCNICPDNIFIADDGTYKLGDFSCAQYAAHGRSKEKVNSPGTYGYIAPELFGADKYYDSRCEMYSLGMTMYVLLNGGKFPFGDVYSAVAAAASGRRVPDIPDVSRDLMRIVKKLCERKPSRRFESDRELLAALMPVVAAHRFKIRLHNTVENAKLAIMKKKDGAEADAAVVAVTDTAPDVGATTVGTPSAAADLSEDAADAGSEWINSIGEDMMNRTVSADTLTDTFAAEDVQLTDQTILSYASDSSVESASIPEIEECGFEFSEHADLDRTYKEMNNSFIRRIFVPFRVRRAVICVLIVLAASYFSFERFVRPQYIRLGDKIVLTSSETLDISGMGLDDVSALESCHDLKILDLRGNDISSDEFDYLQSCLPACKIYWEVPIGGTRIDSETVRLTASDFENGDEKLLEENLRFLPALEDIDMTGSSLDRSRLRALSMAAPDCRVMWAERIEGVDYPIDGVYSFSLSAFDDDMIDALRSFERVEWIDLSASGYDDEKLDLLRKRYPEYNIRWDVRIGGQVYSTETEEIDLGSALLGDAENGGFGKLKYLRKLTKIDLSHTVADDYSFLTECSELRELSLRGASIKDYSPLEKLSGLQRLDIGTNAIDDISFIEKLQDLRILRMDTCKLGRGFEEHLGKLHELRVLDCSFTKTDLTVVHELNNLMVLRAYCGKDDDFAEWGYYEPLKGVTSLKAFFGWCDPGRINNYFGKCEELRIANVSGKSLSSVNLNQFRDNPEIRFICINSPVLSGDLSYLSNLESLICFRIQEEHKKAILEVAPNCLFYTNKIENTDLYDTYFGYDFLMELCELYVPECFE